MNLMKCRIHLPMTILSFAVAMTASLTVMKSIERKSLVELTPANLTSTLTEWEYDSAILFYAPWCQYCKQLLPSWETIAELSTNNHNLIVSKFDCEGSDISASLCKKLKVDRYPSLYFIGYGSFNQGSGGQMIGSSANPRIVQYVSDIYPEAVYDWVYMMAFLSGVNRRWDDLSAFFSGRSFSKEKLASYKKRTIEAERKATLFGKELQKYKANEIFDSLEDRGDPFPLLNSLEPDKQNLPLRVCIEEMAGEYCKYYPDESYCKILPNCAIKNLEPKVCRPDVCPFKEKRGCVVVSTCLSTDIIEEYKKALTTN